MLIQTVCVLVPAAEVNVMEQGTPGGGKVVSHIPYPCVPTNNFPSDARNARLEITALPISVAPSFVQVTAPGNPTEVYKPVEVPTKYSTPALVTAMALLL